MLRTLNRTWYTAPFSVDLTSSALERWPFPVVRRLSMLLQIFEAQKIRQGFASPDCPVRHLDARESVERAARAFPPPTVDPKNEGFPHPSNGLGP